MFCIDAGNWTMLSECEGRKVDGSVKLMREREISFYVHRKVFIPRKINMPVNL